MATNWRLTVVALDGIKASIRFAAVDYVAARVVALAQVAATGEKLVWRLVPLA